MQASVFRSLVEGLNGVLCDCNLRFTQEGLIISDLDYSRVLLRGGYTRLLASRFLY